MSEAMEQAIVVSPILNHPLNCSGAKPEATQLLLNFLHGLQQGMDGESILEALAKGEAIAAPVAKKRGRKRKEAKEEA